jgi:hypothetical protein
MPLWTANDNSNGAPLFAPSTVNKTPNTANRDTMYNNATPSGYITGQTTQVIGVAANQITEVAGAHTGWIRRTQGTGGRAGRVHSEVLVAGGFSTDTQPTKHIAIVTQPSNNSVANNAQATFSIAAAVMPNTTITYQWQLWGGASFADITANSSFTNVTTAAFVITNAIRSVANGFIFRCRVMSTGAANVNSSNAVITITG